MPAPSSSYPYIDLNGPLSYSESSSGDLDTYTAYTDAQGNLSHYSWVMNQPSVNTWTASLNSPSDSSDVVHIYVPQGYAVDGYSLTINSSAINQSAFFDFGSSSGGTFDDYRSLATFTSTNVAGSDFYNITIGSGTNQLSYTLILNILKVNEAPTVTEDYTDPSIFYSGGAAVGLFSNVIVTNEAAQMITKFSLTVDGVQAADSEFLTIGTTDIHLVAGQSGTVAAGVTYTTTGANGSILVSLNMGTGIFSSTLQTLLDGMSYKNTSADPTLGDRYVSFTSISDDGGTAKTGVDTGLLGDYTIVTVAAPLNAAPVVTTDSGSAAFTESVSGEPMPAVIDSGIIVADTDNSTLASAKVSISSHFVLGQDSLLFTNNPATMGDIVAVYHSATGVLDLSSAGSATLAQWQAALRSISYSNSSDNPDTSTRTISYVVNDGTTDSVAGTRDVNVTATNDAPVITNSNGSTGFTEGNNIASTPVVIDSALSLTDVDNTTLASATVSIGSGFQSAEDVLSFTNNPATMGNIIASYAPGTGALNLTSPGHTATLAQWQAALRSVTYTDSSETPNIATRTISFTVNDGSQGSVTSTKTVSVTNVNDTPLVVTTGGSTVFVESASAASTPVVVDSGINLSDVDSTTLASAKVSITGQFHSSEDALSFTNTPSTMGNISASYNASTGVLSLGSAGATATLAQWQAALRSVTYSDSSDNPGTNPRTITFVVNEGHSDSAAVTKTITVTASNDAPVAASSNGATEFTPGNNTASTPVIVDSQLMVNDPDNATLAQATVAITGNFKAGEDELSFTNNGMTTGNITASYNAAVGELTLTSAGGVATLLEWQTALRSVTYTDTAAKPSTDTRTISFTINDNLLDSATVTKDVSVVAIDYSPVLTASTSAPAFTEGKNATSLPVIIDNGLTVSDVDSSQLTRASVSIANHKAGDLLAFVTGGTDIGDIAQSFDAATGVLTLTSAGSATLAQWQAALRSVTYGNDSDTPDTTARTINFAVNDGHSNSVTVSKTLTVTDVNDAPDVTLAAATQSVRQDTPLIFSTANHNLISISDVDAGTSNLQVTLLAASGLLMLGSTTGLTVTGDGSDTITVTGTLAAINAGLNGLKFAPTTGFTGHASINVLVNDQGFTHGIPDPLIASKSLDITVTTPPITPVDPPVTVDGVPVTTTTVTLPNGETGSSITVGLVTDSRQDNTGNPATADIDLVGSGSAASLSAKLPVGYGLTAVGGAPKTAGDSAETLKTAIDAVTPDTDQAHQNVNGQNFLDKLADGALLVTTITPVTSATTPTQPLELNGSNGSQLTALVIDAGQMNGKGSLVLNNVDFAAVVGQSTVQGNTSGQVLTGDDASQSFIVNGSNSFVFAGGGNDTLQITSFAAANNTVLQGGQGNDTVTFSGNSSLYTIEQHGGFTLVSNKDDPNQQVKVVNIESLSFADGTVSIPTDTQQTTLAALYQGLLGRQADTAGFDYWTQQPLSIGGIALSIFNSTEAGAKALNGDTSHDIAALYTAFFGRTVDTGGQQYWTEQVQQGHLSFLQVADSLLTSTEMTGHNKAPATWDFTV